MVFKIYFKSQETIRFSNILVHLRSGLTDIIIQDTVNFRCLFITVENTKYKLQSELNYKNIINEFNQIIFSNDNYLNLDGIFLNDTQIIRRSLNTIEVFDCVKITCNNSKMYELLSTLS